MPFAKHLPSLFAAPSLVALVALMVGFPARADAQVCAANADCPAGTTCQATALPDAKPGCTGPDCPTTGSGGAAGGGGVAIVAPDAVRMTCLPAPCTADSDCGGQMVCHTETISSCSGGTAPPCSRDMKCDPAPTPTCTETKVSACMYKWQLPCSADADCGAGFTCEPNMITSCSGGGPVTGGGTSGGAPTPGAGGSSGATTASDQPARSGPAVDGGTTMCTTTTSFPGWCRATATTCNTDSDCPAPWTCFEGWPSGGTTVSTDPGSSGSGSGGVGRPAALDGGAAPPEGIVAKVKVCQSPAPFPVRGGVATDASGTPKNPPTGGGATSGPGATESTHASNAGCSVAGGVPAPLANLAGLLLGLALVVRHVRRRS